LKFRRALAGTAPDGHTPTRSSLSNSFFVCFVSWFRGLEFPRARAGTAPDDARSLNGVVCA
jgi:hypothetical protein